VRESVSKRILGTRSSRPPAACGSGTADEPFAPVAPITTFGSLEHALEIANATEFGLASYVWTRDLRTAFLASEGIEAGMAGVNNMAVTTAEVPFGGVKHSGYGRVGGAEGVLDYTVVKTTHITL
jgi:succinate-semialdehyde dehydrogenase / glutarate-semialdehyde dehydrogenase